MFLTRLSTLKVESDGSVVSLKHPLNATRFSLNTLSERITELEKISDDIYGTAGFSDEFQVGRDPFGTSRLWYSCTYILWANEVQTFIFCVC